MSSDEEHQLLFGPGVVDRLKLFISSVSKNTQVETLQDRNNGFSNNSTASSISNEFQVFEKLKYMFNKKERDLFQCTIDSFTSVDFETLGTVTFFVETREQREEEDVVEVAEKKTKQSSHTMVLPCRFCRVSQNVDVYHFGSMIGEHRFHCQLKFVVQVFLTEQEVIDDLNLAKSKDLDTSEIPIVDMVNDLRPREKTRMFSETLSPVSWEATTKTTKTTTKTINTTNNTIVDKKTQEIVLDERKAAEFEKVLSGIQSCLLSEDVVMSKDVVISKDVVMSKDIVKSKDIVMSKDIVVSASEISRTSVDTRREKKISNNKNNNKGKKRSKMDVTTKMNHLMSAILKLNNTTNNTASKLTNEERELLGNTVFDFVLYEDEISLNGNSESTGRVDALLVEALERDGNYMLEIL